MGETGRESRKGERDKLTVSVPNPLVEVQLGIMPSPLIIPQNALELRALHPKMLGTLEHVVHGEELANKRCVLILSRELSRCGAQVRQIAMSPKSGKRYL